MPLSRLRNCLKLGILVPMILFLIGAVLGCGSKNEFVEPPPPAVTVSKPHKQKITEYLEFTGRTKGIETVEIRARVEGFLESAHFQEGGFIDKDQLLYVIDPKPYRAALDGAEAELQNQRVRRDRAKIEYDRRVSLFKQKAASEADVVEWETELAGAKVGINAAQAEVEKAQLNLGYTNIYAPISGRIGKNEVDVGNLVGAGEFTLLTTITKYNPIYAYFSINERDLLRIMKRNRKEQYTATELAWWPVELGLANEEDYPHKGQLDWADVGADPDTGSMLLRGVFPNPGPPFVIIPGLFVRIRLPIAERDDALLVTERALGLDQGGRYLLVVNAENVVEQRYVKIGALIEGKRVIEEGLQGNESIVVKGLQRAIPGAKVTPEPGKDAATKPAPPDTAPAEESEEEPTKASTSSG